MGNRALLVGIEMYPGDPLNGAINNINDMAEFLVEACGFVVSDIRLLADARANKAAIIDHLGWLLTGVQKGDRILFHYSGHGALFPPRNSPGDVTGLYDSLVPIDFDWSSEHAITSVDLDHIFAPIPSGVEFLFVCDSCNSGNMIQANNVQSSGLRPPADIAWRIRTAAEKNMVPRPLTQENCALLAACKSGEDASYAQIGGVRYNGVFTHFLIQSLKEPDGLTIPLKLLMQRVQKSLADNDFGTQTPRLTGPDELQERPFLQP